MGKNKLKIVSRSFGFLFHLILIDLEFSYSVIVNDPVAAVPGEDPQHRAHQLESLLQLLHRVQAFEIFRGSYV